MKNILRKIKHLLVFFIYFIPMLFYKKDTYKIYDDKKTIDLIVNENLSLCRYGDGEFKWMLGIKQKSFQDDDGEMKNKLLNIFKDKDSKVLIGIPLSLNNCNGLTFQAKSYWMQFIIQYHCKIEKVVLKDKQYCNANVTRPYIDYKFKKHNIMEKKFANVKRIWDKRSILLVEGTYSRLGVSNDIFDNALCIRRIICPPKNAFKKYSEIFDSIENNYNNGDIVLISLGPTATILAYEIGNKGIQCIDIGHIDIEYEWFLRNAKTKISIDGKFVNEAQTNKKISDVTDKKYNEQIIDIISED